jgi:hypothetical protein
MTQQSAGLEATDHWEFEPRRFRATSGFFRPWDLMALARLSPAVRTKVGAHFTERRLGTHFFLRSLCAATVENSARDQALRSS